MLQQPTELVGFLPVTQHGTHWLGQPPSAMPYKPMARHQHCEQGTSPRSVSQCHDAILKITSHFCQQSYTTAQRNKPKSCNIWWVTDMLSWAGCPLKRITLAAIFARKISAESGPVDGWLHDTTGKKCDTIPRLWKQRKWCILLKQVMHPSRPCFKSLTCSVMIKEVVFFFWRLSYKTAIAPYNVMTTVLFWLRFLQYIPRPYNCDPPNPFFTLQRWQIWNTWHLWNVMPLSVL